MRKRDAAIVCRQCLWLALMIAAVVPTACSQSTRKPVFPARGQVLINGKPAAGATVFFNPVESDAEAIAPYGVTDANGTFTLTTYLTFDGAPAGEYVVTIRAPGPPQRGEDDQGPDRLKGRYNDAKKSTLRATIEKKANVLEPFQLTAK